MRKIIAALGTLLYVGSALSQIYYKEIIYVFDYTIEKENGSTQKGLIYLGCLGKPWPIKEEKQAAVIWTTDKLHLLEKRFTTGIYEEKDRIWLHPPRDDKFRILEYSPWPYIYFPVSENKSWKRELALGEYWADPKNGIQADDILKFDYVNAGFTSYQLKYKSRKIECSKIEAESTNIHHQTRFVGLFHPEYGFVKMDFRNVDKSIIKLEFNHILYWDQLDKTKKISFPSWGN